MVTMSLIRMEASNVICGAFCYFAGAQSPRYVCSFPRSRRLTPEEAVMVPSPLLTITGS